MAAWRRNAQRRQSAGWQRRAGGWQRDAGKRKREAGRRRGYYHSPGNPPVDALVMVKSLAAHGDAA